MMKLLLPLSLAAGLSINLAAAESRTAPPSRESVEWCDIWISHVNETNLPRVLLIGDSIARDYYPEVEKHLAGKAFVGRLSTSRFHFNSQGIQIQAARVSAEVEKLLPR